MTLDARLLMGVSGMAVLMVALVALVFIADRRLRAIEAEQRRIHLQQATIIGMLVRAGFRRPKATHDWGDSALATRSHEW